MTIDPSLTADPIFADSSATLCAQIFAALGACGALVAAFAAWFAARATRNAVLATRDTAEASLVYSFRRDYSKQVMSDGMRRLGDWRRDNDNDFAETWLSRLKKKDSAAVKVDEDRRRVKSYFETAADLQKNGFIREQAYRTICFVAGINIYYDVVYPIEKALNPDGSSRLYDYLMNTIGRHRYAEDVEPVPPSS